MLAGCSSVATAPVIDDLQMPSTATVGSDGYFDVNGTISFHDDSGVVNKIRIYIPAVLQTYEFAAEAGASRATVALQVKFAAATPKGAIEYDVSLLDATGVPSEARKQTVILQ
jgi:hypothetical protein